MEVKRKPRVRLYRARYALITGQRGTLMLLAGHSCDAMCMTFDLLGEALCRVSVRPAT